MIDIASHVIGKKIRYTTLPRLAFGIGGLFNPSVKEAEELLPRYRQDNIFDSTKFATRFPDFPITSYRDGITHVLKG